MKKAPTNFLINPVKFQMFIKIVLIVLLTINFQYTNGLSVVVKETAVPFTFEDSPPQPPSVPILDNGQFLILYKKKKSFLIVKI